MEGNLRGSVIANHKYVQCRYHPGAVQCCAVHMTTERVRGEDNSLKQRLGRLPILQARALNSPPRPLQGRKLSQESMSCRLSFFRRNSWRHRLR